MPECKHPSSALRFDGDDPYVICTLCGERRDAVTGVVVTQGRPLLSNESNQDSKP